MDEVDRDGSYASGQVLIVCHCLQLLILWCLTSLFPPTALFLLDNRLEVYLWQREVPEQMESPAPACSRWQSERRCAMEMVLQYCRGGMESEEFVESEHHNITVMFCFFFLISVSPEVNPRRPPLAYLISEGAEPLTFTNVFPHWERSPEANTQVQTAEFQMNVFTAPAMLCLQSGSLVLLLLIHPCLAVHLCYNVTKALFLIQPLSLLLQPPLEMIKVTMTKKKPSTHFFSSSRCLQRSSALR